MYNASFIQKTEPHKLRISESIHCILWMHVGDLWSTLPVAASSVSYRHA